MYNCAAFVIVFALCFAFVPDISSYGQSEPAQSPENSAQEAEPPSGKQAVSEKVENGGAMSLDGAALNQLLPVPENPNPVKGRQQKKTKAKNPKPKNNNPGSKQEEDQEQKTVIPRMTPVKWIYSITGTDSGGSVQKTSKPKAIKHGLSKQVHEHIWDNDMKRLICSCGHHICTSEARMNDIKYRQGVLCCPVIVWDEVRDVHPEPLPPPVIVNPQKDYNGHKIEWDAKHHRYRCSCGHEICTEGKRFYEKRHGKENCCPILVWTEGYGFSAKVSPSVD